ncbi:hypothetical protein GGF32_002089 [Allomyces javanicus]|nr:hypothetical protein GGF32_002089 [Allomyces javanicus]
MAMSLKQELVQWDEAVKAYDAGDYELALDLFQPIADSSKIFFNMGMIFQGMGQLEDAILAYNDAVLCDNYLSVAYFQKGVCHYQLGEYDDAHACFHDALLFLRGNYLIDYTQLGLAYRLYACEILYNRALASFAVGDDDAAMDDLAEAAKGKKTPDHGKIDDAIRARGSGCRAFLVPLKLVYRPPPAKIANADRVDYMGKSRVIAARNTSDNFVEFQGARGVVPDPEPDIKPICTLDRTSPPSSLPRVDTDARDRRPSATPNRTSPTSPAPARYGRRGSDASRNGRGTPTPPPPSRRMPSPAPARVRSPYDAGVRRGSGGSEYAPSMYSKESVIAGKLRVKVHFDGDTRVLLLPGDASFDEMLDKIEDKLRETQFRVRFRDEDGELVSMTDDDDLVLARSLAADENKIEVWCQ